jgi:hypothetical protein
MVEIAIHLPSFFMGIGVAITALFVLVAIALMTSL